MYGIYANIGGILMGSMLPYIAYMDPMGYIVGKKHVPNHQPEYQVCGKSPDPESSSSEPRKGRKNSRMCI